MADIDDRLERVGDAILAQPILIVVPSRSLRLHLLDRIVAHRGGAAAGIRCLTLRGAAREILSQATPLQELGADLLPILVRRLSSREPSLQRSLGHLHDSFAAVVGPIEDLLDAGFEPALEEALEEVLEEEGREQASSKEVERARALVRIAGRCLEILSQERVARIPDLLQQATERIRLRPESVRAASILIYGFADATGVATDLIQALLESRSGTLYLDRPPDPAWPEETDEGIVFARRFEERLLLVTGEPDNEPVGSSQGSIQMVRALGGQAELRHVADRVRSLLDKGTEPESIGVVTRQLDPYISGLRTHFWRMGVPFSAVGAAGPRTDSGRRVEAVLDLLREGRSVPVERWLDASLGWTEKATLDLMLAFYGFGAGRLEEAADLELPKSTADRGLTLPVQGGLPEQEDDDNPTNRSPERRKISGSDVLRAREEAHRLCESLDGWQTVEVLEHHISQLRNLLLDHLQWPAEGELTLRLIQSADRLRAQTRAELPLSFDELVRWLEAAWSEIGRDPLGGRGGGVQVLDVTEARGRTFEHLFLVGMNRGIFPRTIREDPLLPDSLRRALSREGYGVLPDLARKLSGFAEERFLFAQLIASSRSVTLSWQEVDDDGSSLVVSPLVERMRWSDVASSHEEWREPPTVQPLFTLAGNVEAVPDRAPRLAYEHAINAAFSGPRNELRGFLSAALEEGADASFDWRSHDDCESIPAAATAQQMAEARIRLLQEMDPVRGGDEGEDTFGRLGPFFGFVGPILDSQDLRFGRRLYVTALEGLAACSWQTFLVRLLRLEALPDPLEILPGINPLLVGDLVHRCLERLVASQLPTAATDLETARTLTPQLVTWPTDRQLDVLLERQAEIVARRHGIGMRGFPSMLARVVRPYLEQARDLEWASGKGVPVGAVEVEGSLEWRLEDGEEQELFFKADRFDLDETGEKLVDYKTGRNDISSGAKAETRDRSLIKRIRAGKSLQAITYALAAQGRGARGRYLFLNPDLDGPESARDIGIDNTNEEARLAFRRATDTLLAAWRRGSFLPRLVEADQDRAPRRCEFCQVAEACLRYDSGARGRLRTWTAEHLEAFVEGPDRNADAESAGIGVWLLDSKRLEKLDDSAAAGGGDS